MIVGSECINKFQILAVGAGGELLDQSERRSKVRRDRGRLISDARKRRVINALVTLATRDEAFDIHSFIEYLQERGAFTPNQLSLLWQLDKSGVPYELRDFKVAIHRDREKHQLAKMEDWKLAKILPTLSSPQRKYVARHRGSS